MTKPSPTGRRLTQGEGLRQVPEETTSADRVVRGRLVLDTVASPRPVVGHKFRRGRQHW